MQIGDFCVYSLCNFYKKYRVMMFTGVNDLYFTFYLHFSFAQQKT